MEFFYGAATGLAMSLMLGTVFFVLIQNSIDNGYRGGVLIALGVITSDTLMITLSIFGTAFLPPVPHFDTYASLAGGMLLLTLGFFSLLKESPRLVYPATRLGNLVYYFSSGFVLNGINPANFFIWVAVTANLRANLHYSPTQTSLFFLGCLSAIFLTEVGISVSADRLKRYFTPRILTWINKVSGSAFVLLGLRLLWTGWKG
ncbi:MAG: LysE family transporter [Ferruginibacter sp.]|nr:LysE family transporter [Cytophagales bacterium]